MTWTIETQLHKRLVRQSQSQVYKYFQTAFLSHVYSAQRSRRNIRLHARGLYITLTIVFRSRCYAGDEPRLKVRGQHI
jgi:hypothetical protein